MHALPFGKFDSLLKQAALAIVHMLLLPPGVPACSPTHLHRINVTKQDASQQIILY
jgi:hypothetical protein